MARTTATSSESLVRQLKLLVVVLTLSNLAVGGVSFYLLRKVDRAYSELIDRSVPALNDLQTLTARSVLAMRSTNPTHFGESAGQINRVEAVQKGFAAVRRLHGKLKGGTWIGGDSGKRKAFEAAGENFLAAGDKVLAALEAGQISTATSLRETELRPAFDRYLDETTQIADVLEAASRQANDSVSARTGLFSNVLLGVGTWPIIVLASLLLLTAIFVLVLMLLFRGREMGDVP